MTSHKELLLSRKSSQIRFAGDQAGRAAELRDVRKPLNPAGAVSDKVKAASNAFEAAKAMVFFAGVIAFLVFLVIGYIATGGDSVGGFLDFVLGWWV